MKVIFAPQNPEVQHLNHVLLAFLKAIRNNTLSEFFASSCETKCLTFALLFCVLLLPISLTYLFSLMHLNVLQNVVATLCFTRSAAAALLYVQAVSPSEQRPEDLFLFWPWAKNSRCPKGHPWFGGLQNKFIGYTKPVPGDAYRSLQLCYADFRPATPFIWLARGERDKRNGGLPWLPPELARRSKGRRDSSSPTRGLFFLYPRLGNIPAPSDATYCLSVYKLLTSNLENYTALETYESFPFAE